MLNQNKLYVPSKEAIEFISFIKACGVEKEDTAEIHYKLADKFFSKHKQVVIEAFRGSAKALALDEVVYGEDREITIRDVCIGDKIYGADGKLTKVIAKSEIFFKDTYEVEMIDGRTVTCSGDHLWDVHIRGASKHKDSMRRVTKCTKDMFDNQWYYRKKEYRNPKGREQKYSIELNKPILYNEQVLPIEPYTLGAIIGDGNVSKDTGYSRITSHKDDIDELMFNIPYTKGKRSVSGENAFIQGILGLGSAIKSLGLNVNTYNKFIPNIYKKSSVAQRIALVQGLMDTDGTVDIIKNKSSYFCTCNRRLADDFMEVVRSLGTECRLRYEDNDFAGSWKVYLKHNTFNPFRLHRKAERVSYGKKLWLQKIKEIRKVETVPTQCIMVDNDSKLFLTTNFVVTHNSTLMVWLVIYIAVKGKLHNFGEVKFIAFIGDSAERGVKNFFKNIAKKIDSSKFLQQYITVKKMNVDEAELVNLNGHQLNLKGLGMATNIRGITYDGDRPEIVILDDVITNDALTSETIRKNIEDNFFLAVVPALHPTKYRFYVIGTPISESDLLATLKNNKEWVVHRFPVCDKFPCSEKEFKSNWEDRFPYSAVLAKYKFYDASGKKDKFAQEYMLEITDSSDLLVDEKTDVKWLDVTESHKYKHQYNIYIATDFATSSKKSADYSTIGVIGLNNNNDWMLLDGICKKQSMSDNINDLFELVRKWNPLTVGIETSGQQGGFISILEDEMIKRNTWFTFAKKQGSKEVGIRPSSDKVKRFVTGVQHKFKQGKVYLPRIDNLKDTNPYLLQLVEELLREFSKFTLNGGVKALKHDDALDLFNQFSEMEKFIPSKDEYVEEVSNNGMYDPFSGNDTEIKTQISKRNLIF